MGSIHIFHDSHSHTSFVLSVSLLFFRPDCPAHFRGTGSAVLRAFFCRGPHYIFGIVCINSVPAAFFQCSFYQFVFTGMERENRDSSSGFQCSRQLFHELIQYFKFTVHINTQSLERSLTGLLDRIFFLLFREKIQGLLDQLS